jgi:hypothetical protein
LEIGLKLDLGGGMIIMSPNQDEAPPEFIEMNRYGDRLLGHHLGRRVALSPQEGINGYLSYTIPPGEFISDALDMATLERLDKTLQIIDHVSSTTITIPLRPFGRFSFREGDQVRWRRVPWTTQKISETPSLPGDWFAQLEMRGETR